MIFHKHHIVPKHAGGTDDPSNIIKVNIPMHIFLHKLRWEELGDKYDYIAYSCLEGQMLTDEASIAASLEAKSRVGRKTYEQKIGIHNPEKRSYWASLGGKVAGKLPNTQKQKDVASETVKKTNCQKWVCPYTGKIGVARVVNRHQRELGLELLKYKVCVL